jgi:ABC-type nitrate/sulfonate/bicarbonate transport system permease component
MTARRFSGRLSWRPNLAGLLTMAACGLAWELTIQAGIFDFQYLPAPSAVIQGAGELVASGELAAATVHTLESVFLGWTIAVAAGVSLGLLIGFSPLLRRYSLATIEVLRPMPAIAFVPVALLLFGFSIQMELMVIVLPSLWPVLINTMGGMMGVHARLGEVGRTFRLSRAAMLCKVFLPAATPAILVGMRISLTLAVVLAVLAEMVGNPEGLGYGVVSQQQALRPDLMFVYVVVIGLLGLALNALLIGIVSVSFPAAAAELKGYRS